MAAITAWLRPGRILERAGDPDRAVPHYLPRRGAHQSITRNYRARRRHA